MGTSLLGGILDSIESNLENKAILFYTGKNWQSVTYREVHAGSKLVEETLREIVSEKWNYIVIYLKIMLMYPVLILGILKANFGFICVGEGDTSLLNDFIKSGKAKYILSKDNFCHDKCLLSSVYICEKKITIFGENIFLWVSQCDTSYPDNSSFLYCIKTSGTTGLSKTIQVPHCCIFPNVKDLSELLKITCDDKILFMTPVTFDPSVIELFLAFYNGCSLCILDTQIKEDPQKMIDVLFSTQSGLVTILQTTPSLLKRWNLIDIREKVLHRTSSLRALILGGEEFPSIEELITWNVSRHITVYNIYGLTEISCWASINQVFPSKELSNHIGESLSETVMKLSDVESKNGRELLIGSSTRKCLVSDEISKNIFKDGEVLFRNTGDLFKNVGGKLFFIGRKDDSVKRWGLRFSLVDVEQASLGHENTLSSCCVVVKFENYHRLGLFIVQKKLSPLKDLKSFLRKRLPQSAFPDLIEALPALPLTNHGKVCKATLRNLCSKYSKTDVKQLFDELWENYTEVSSGDHSYLSAGGNSLGALQFFNELKLRFPVTPDTFLGMLLQNKTKNELRVFLSSSEINEKTEVDRQMLNEVGLKPPDEILPHTCSHTHVTRTYLKGKKTFKCYCVLKNKEIGNVTNLKIKVEWKYNLGKCIDGSPLGVELSNNKRLAIVGSHIGVVVVLDVDNQAVISLCSLPDRVESSACIADNGNVYYIGCYDGCLYCIGTETGNIIWKFQTNDLIKSTAVIYSNNIIFGSYDTNMYCLDPDSRLQWKTKLKSPILTEPVVNDSVLYIATLGSIAAISLESGLLLMEINSTPVFSTPVISERNLVVANVKGEVMWLNMKTGHMETSFLSEDMIFSSLVKVVQNNKEVLVYGCHDAHVYCLKERNILWKTALDSKIVSTPYVKITDSSNFQGFIICFSSTGKGYLLNFSSGEKISEIKLPGEVFSSPVVMGRTIIVGCRDDNVYLLKLNTSTSQS